MQMNEWNKVSGRLGVEEATKRGRSRCWRNDDVKTGKDERERESGVGVE